MGQVVVCHLLVPPGLFLLQRLGGVGAHEAEGLDDDSGQGNQQHQCQCSEVDCRGVIYADEIVLQPAPHVEI